jgi:hypothetical protein
VSTDAQIDAVPAAGGDDAKQQPASAPYMSYKGFQNYLTRFSEEGLPGRFDGSYFGNASGSLVAQVRGTLRYLDLIDEDKHPTDLLKTIVDADEGERKQYLKMIFEEKYADALVLNKNATAGQLADVFRERGLSGATVQKAITFFLGMAEDVGVELSPHFKKGRVSAGNGTTRRRATKRTEQPTPPPAPPAVQQTEDNSPEALRAKYVNLLMKKVEASESELPADLLDRIERALGYEEKSSPATTGKGNITDMP